MFCNEMSMNFVTVDGTTALDADACVVGSVDNQALSVKERVREGG